MPRRSPRAGASVANGRSSIKPSLLPGRMPLAGLLHPDVANSPLRSLGSGNRLLSPAKYAAVAFFSKYACNPPQSVLGERLAGKRHLQCAPVAQLDRAPDYESGGQRFESFRARHFLDAGCRGRMRRIRPVAWTAGATAAFVRFRRDGSGCTEDCRRQLRYITLDSQFREAGNASLHCRGNSQSGNRLTSSRA